jgi:UDP-N-acetylglucosamine--N-acetylmuramyl-(pentapeptide) pyrophosphoryl-undecaprenol N-acetylglucosamine transferase
MRTLIAGGGTGGHIYPGIAIAKALEKKVSNVEILFVGAQGGVEAAIFSDAGLSHHLLPGRGIRGAALGRRMKGPFVFLVALVKAMKIVHRFKPDVVVGTGGYASAAVVLASLLLRKRTVLQEQNSVPGMVNRVLSRYADLVLLAYEESREFIPAHVRCKVIGNPLRFDSNHEIEREAACRRLGIRSDLPTVVVFGGSQGARSLNTHGADAADRIQQHGEVQFLFLSGPRDFERVQSLVGKKTATIRVFSFIEEMDMVYTVADVAISRAGASSVFELASFGVPTVFIPYPHAADDHQNKNVVELENIGAALVLQDAEVTGDTLAHHLSTLLSDGETRQRMSEKLKQWFKRGASEQAAEEIAAVGAKKKEKSIVSHLFLMMHVRM